MIGDKQRNARLQSDFYRDSYHKMLRFLIFMCLIILLLIGGIIYYVLFQPAPQYYASTSQGEVVELVPQNK